jgi:NitT/TauT family transport system substrate-binding protein
MRPLVVVLSLTLLAAAVAGPGLAQAPGAPEKPNLQVGILRFSESLPAVAADKRGFFRDEGLKVEFSRFNSGAESMPLLLAGKLDIIFSNTIATLQALEQGLEATIIAPGAVARPQPPDSTGAVMVLKGTARTPKDLEGKRIAVNVINSTTWLYLVALLDKHGVDRSKVRIVEIGFHQMNDPLLNGQVDAIVQVEPFRTVLNGTGKAEIIGWVYVDVQPNADITQYVALTPWVSKHPATTARFVRAIVKGAQFMNQNEADTRALNVEFTNLNPALKDKVQIPRFGTEVNLAEIRKTMDLMTRFGLLKGPVDVAKRVRAQ